MPILSCNPPEFTPTKKITAERLKMMDNNGEGFL
jgi:hypothetical protein